jgi:hypothetical protein
LPGGVPELPVALELGLVVPLVQGGLLGELPVLAAVLADIGGVPSRHHRLHPDNAAGAGRGMGRLPPEAPPVFRVNVDRLHAFVRDMETWMREGDVVRRKTLLREVYQEIRI